MTRTAGAATSAVTPTSVSRLRIRARTREVLWFPFALAVATGIGMVVALAGALVFPLLAGAALVAPVPAACFAVGTVLVSAGAVCMVAAWCWRG